MVGGRQTMQSWKLMFFPMSTLVVALLLQGCNESNSEEDGTDFLSTTTTTTAAARADETSTSTVSISIPDTEVEANVSGANETSSSTATSSSIATSSSTATTTTPSMRWPANIMHCPNAPVQTTESLTCAQYDAIVSTIRNIYTQLDTRCTATECPQADWAGCVLRVAGHDFMDFGDGEGGSDGCLDLFDPDNAGLPECLHSGEFGFSIQDAYSAHCSEISLADFIVLAAEAVITFSREHATGGNTDMDLKSKFKFGRTTAARCEFAEGRLPNPEDSCDAVDATFRTRMGLSWRRSAALMGVHSLGRARPENSGYDGWWSDAVNSRKFNNNYYASIVGKGWMPEHLSANKNQWKRSDAGANRGSTDGKEMMLNTDMCLAYTADDNGNRQLNAATTNCCAWTDEDNIPRAIRDHLDGEFCGSTNIPNRAGDQRELCCDGERDNDIDCGDFREPAGPAIDDVFDFARDEQEWLEVFRSAWTEATENGFSDLQPLSGC